jgi:hypothetical protein
MNSAGDQPHGLGLPHSEIRESTSARLSSRLFAACHVLHRLSVPRHPPDALITLDPELPNNCAARRDKPRHATANLQKTQIPVKKARSFRRPVARPTKTHDLLTGPRFTQIHNIKQQPISIDRTNVFGLPQSRTDALALIDPLPNNLVVEVNGIEPMTSCLQSRRSTN